MIMVAGTIAGVETGAQCIQHLKHQANVDVVVGIGFILVLVFDLGVHWLGELADAEDAEKTRRKKSIAAGECRQLKKDQAVPPRLPRYLKTRSANRALKKDESVIGEVPKRIHRFHLPPMISLPISGIERISLWSILGVAFVGGVFSGFLGGGAGYIRMPSMVFLLGVPTHVAVGTDLFEIIISASYGTLTHAIKGNVDIMVALVMHTGAAIGAQIGAT